MFWLLCSFVLIPQLYFAFKKCKSKNLNSTHESAMKISNNTELQQITFHLSSDIKFKDFMTSYKNINWKTMFLFSQ